MRVDEAGRRSRYNDSGLTEPLSQRSRGEKDCRKCQGEHQRDREAERLSRLGFRDVPLAQGPDCEACAIGDGGNAGEISGIDSARRVAVLVAASTRPI